jgi:AraC-like DNA-binding protein
LGTEDPHGWRADVNAPAATGGEQLRLRSSSPNQTSLVLSLRRPRLTPRLNAAASNTRQLTRLFNTELGTTPARYVEMVRIDSARAALDADRTVADTARLTGFGSAETLGRVFVNHLRMSPKAYRDRFRTTSRVKRSPSMLVA